MGKLGFVNVCHPDYVSVDSLALGEEAEAHLKKNGIELICADGVVTDHRQAREVAHEFLSRRVDGEVIFYGAFVLSNVVMDLVCNLADTPLFFWGVPMLERDGRPIITGSYVAYSMFAGTLNRLKIPYDGMIAAPDGDDVISRLHAFIRAASTKRRLKETRVGLVGYTSMSIYPGTFDHVLLRYLIGPEVEHIDSYSLINLADKVEDKQIREAAALLDNVAEMSEGVPAAMREKALRLFIAVRELCQIHDLQAITVKCQYEFSKEYGMIMCVPLSLLADQGMITGCEGDMPCLISTVILNYISGQTAGYGDAINHEGNILKLSPCGFMPFSLGRKPKKIVKSEYPHFNGLLCSFVMRPEPVTLLRLVEDVGGFNLMYFTGQGLPSALRGGVMPSLDIEIEGSIESLVRNYPGQHFAITYGDWSREIELLAQLLRIPVQTI